MLHIATSANIYSQADYRGEKNARNGLGLLAKSVNERTQAQAYSGLLSYICANQGATHITKSPRYSQADYRDEKQPERVLLAKPVNERTSYLTQAYYLILSVKDVLTNFI